MDRSIHFSSESNEWATPAGLFDQLNEEFRFTLDAAATPENAKCERFYTQEEDGLVQSWKGERVWLNPPYGRDLRRWIEKAVSEPSEITVMLIPARTETRWWSLFWNHEKHSPRPGVEVRFIKGRLKFGGVSRTHRSRPRSSSCEKDAPFASAIVVLRND